MMRKGVNHKKMLHCGTRTFYRNIPIPFHGKKMKMVNITLSKMRVRIMITEITLKIGMIMIMVMMMTLIIFLTLSTLFYKSSYPESCTMNDTSRYIATGDSIPLPLSLPLYLFLGDQTTRYVEGSVRGDGRSREGGRDGEGVRIIIWDSSTLCAVESIQIPLSTATGNR